MRDPLATRQFSLAQGDNAAQAFVHRPAKLSLSDFQNLFSSNIRAILNWEMLQAEDAQVDTLVITRQSELASLFTVWHVNPEGEFADWDNPEASPLTVGDSLNSQRLWSDERRYNVAKFQQEFASSAEPVNLLLPVYAAGERLVLLDSTHRAVAVHQDNLPFSAMLVALKGPVSEQVLPGLRWHANDYLALQESEALNAP